MGKPNSSWLPVRFARTGEYIDIRTASAKEQDLAPVREPQPKDLYRAWGERGTTRHEVLEVTPHRLSTLITSGTGFPLSDPGYCIASTVTPPFAGRSLISESLSSVSKPPFPVFRPPDMEEKPLSPLVLHPEPPLAVQ